MRTAALFAVVLLASLALASATTFYKEEFDGQSPRAHGPTAQRRLHAQAQGTNTENTMDVSRAMSARGAQWCATVCGHSCLWRGGCVASWPPSRLSALERLLFEAICIN
jgi:hypothetical protein